jgi:hypothetical protein
MACSVEDYPANRTGFERNTINGKPVAAIGIGAFGQKMFPAPAIYRKLTVLMINGARGYG